MSDSSSPISFLDLNETIETRNLRTDLENITHQLPSQEMKNDEGTTDALKLAVATTSNHQTFPHPQISSSHEDAPLPPSHFTIYRYLAIEDFSTADTEDQARVEPTRDTLANERFLKQAREIERIGKEKADTQQEHEDLMNLVFQER